MLMVCLRRCGSAVLGVGETHVLGSFYKAYWLLGGNVTSSLTAGARPRANAGSAETAGASFPFRLAGGGSPAQNQFLDLGGPGADLSES